MFSADTMDYSGHAVRPGRLEHVSRTTDAICGHKTPTSITEMRSFSGLCNVFRQFVHNSALILATLNQHLKKDQPDTFLRLKSDELDAMKSLKAALVTSLVQAVPFFGGRAVLDTDACNFQVGLVLLQKQLVDIMKLIDYESRSLTDTEKWYEAT